MEYALAVALIATVIIGTVQVFSDNAGTRFEASGNSIGTPAPIDFAATTVAPESTTTLPPTTTAPPAPSSSTSCSGRTCTLTLSNLPAGSTASWRNSPGGATETGTTVQATAPPGATTYTITWTIAPSASRSWPR